MAVLPPVKLLSFSFCKSKQSERTWKHFRYEINTFIQAAMMQRIVSDWPKLRNELHTPGSNLGRIGSGRRSGMRFGRERGQEEGNEGSMRKGREATIYTGSQSTGVFWDLVSFHKLFLWKGCPHQTQNWEWGEKRFACRGTEMVDQAVVCLFVCFAPAAPVLFQHETRKLWDVLVSLVLFLVKAPILEAAISKGKKNSTST